MVDNSCGYQFVASGYTHNVFRKGNYAYKTVKDAFEDENCREHFETECFALKLMHKKGLCVPSECRILSPEESLWGRWTLKESWINGIQYRDGEMSLELERKIFDKLIEISQSITGDYYGPISNNAGGKYTWHSYLSYLHQNQPLTRIACPNLQITDERIDELIISRVPRNPVPVFITMDTNLMNFFFDECGDIIGITDVEHPVFGDFLFLLADIRWCRDHWFHRNDWYSFWVANRFDINNDLIDLYEFLIAFQEIGSRFKAGTSHPTIDHEFLLLEDKLLQL